jgi:arylsulfatase A-like enzyme
MRRLTRLALLLAPLASACGGSADGARPRTVIWIEVDTLRADTLGCYGASLRGEGGAELTPHIDQLAAEGARFEHAYSTAPWTIPSLVSQLTGLWPWEHGVLRLLQRVEAERLHLAQAFRARGWSTAGVMTNFIATSRYGLAAGFERWDDALARGHEGSTSHEAVDRLLALCDEAGRAGAEQRFLFLWLFEPHYRYEEHVGLRFGPGWSDEQDGSYAGPLQGDEDLNDLLARRKTLTSEDVAFLCGRYAGEVAYVDRAVGRLVAGLRERGLYDDALIVLTADHGEELLDRGWLGHAVTLHEELVRVPLILRLPSAAADGTQGRAIPDRVSLIDLPATVLALATGAEPDRARRELGHSRSLAPTILEGTRPERRWLYLHTDYEPLLQDLVSDEKRALAWGVVDAATGRKWIVDHRQPSGSPPRAELYDLPADPLEQADLAATAAPDVGLQRLRALVPEALEGARAAPARLPEEPWMEGGERDGLGPGFER